MNPLRKVFLGLSRMPPALMLLIIIVLATLVTMMVTGGVAQREAQLERSLKASVVIARKTIPAHTQIERSMLRQKRAAEISVWEDAVTSMQNAVGKTTVNKIPAQAQIRQVDLDF